MSGRRRCPGLAAKPLIDIILVVADSSDEDAYVPGARERRLQLRIRGTRVVRARRLFRGPDTNVQRPHVLRGLRGVRRMLAFRDWLRTRFWTTATCT